MALVLQPLGLQLSLRELKASILLIQHLVAVFFVIQPLSLDIQKYLFLYHRLDFLS
jgi:hypothetical protein